MYLRVVVVLSLVSCVRMHEQDLKGALETFLARLQANESDHSGRIPVLPILNLDLISLLRLIAKHEQQDDRKNERSVDSCVDKVKSTVIKPSSQNLDLITLGTKKYFFSKNQKLTWIQASWFCRMHGMDLVSVETKEENELIVKHFQSLGWANDTGVFTSGNKIGSSWYTWGNGAPLGYTNWHPQEPQSIATQHCLCYWKSQWADYFCNSGDPFHFICEEP